MSARWRSSATTSENDASPNGYPGFPNTLPVHSLAIRVMGVDIFDNLDLERVAATARGLRRYMSSCSRPRR